MSSSLYGRWDLVVGELGKQFPSWVELGQGSGSFVGQVGSARPVSTVEVTETTVKWVLPPQYEGRKTDMEFVGTLEGEILVGTTTDKEGNTIPWSGKRAPAMTRSGEPTWGEPIELVGADLSNWFDRSPNWVNNWSITENGLENSAVGSDLITKDKFSDFKLIAEYRYPKGSNSGIYLRGRYEFQILDDLGVDSHVGGSGAIYGFLKPVKNAVKGPDEWQTAEITLLGRTATVVLNGELVVDQMEIPGITGGALDSDEGAAGPLFVQGDHGPVTFRKLTLIPATF